MKTSAVLSSDGRYRYELWRSWGPHDGSAAPCLHVIMLNPSTADAEQDDPTIRRCITLAKRLSFLQLIVTNLFAFRATSPRDLMRAAHPIGPDNDAHIRRGAALGDVTLVAWGAHGGYLRRSETVAEHPLGDRNA
jgi:hypothetical protein